MEHVPHSIPPELLTRPRRVRLTRPLFHCLCIGVLGAAAFAAFMGVLLLIEFIGNVGLTVGGTDVTARVTSVTVRRDTKHGMTYWVDFEFDNAGATNRGRIVSSESELSVLRAAGLPSDAIGGTISRNTYVPIPIRTWTFGPWRKEMSNATFQGPSAYILIPALGFVVLLPLGMGGSIAILVCWISRYRLYRHGQPTPGKVIEKVATSAKGVPLFDVRYEYLAPDGVRHEGMENVRRRDFLKIDVGQPVTVLHPEGKPKPSVVYEYGGYRCD